jgi:predicted MPP superfamily phosphohydrolase
MAENMTRRTFIKHAVIGIGGFGLPTIGASAYATKIEPADVEITRVNIPIKGLPATFDGLKLVQISDLHLGEWMTLKQMLSIVQQVNALKPDVIAITGDLLSRIHANTFDEITQSVQGLIAPEGIFATLGNHDHWTSARRAVEAVENTGNAQMLLNRNVALQRGDATLYVAGVDDIWEKKHDLNKALDGIPNDAAVILLAHEPDYVDEVATTKRVGLQLSGHSHGGQVRLPIKGALLLPRLGEKYDMGLYNVNGTMLYVNRGLGMVAPYVRFGCRPEITEITLKTA